MEFATSVASSVAPSSDHSTALLNLRSSWFAGRHEGRDRHRIHESWDFITLAVAGR